MGIKQEVRVEGRKPVVETTAYGAKVVKSSTEGIKDQPADDAAGQDGADAAPAVTKASELFSKLISGIVDGGKAMPAQKDIEEFGKRCEAFVEAVVAELPAAEPADEGDKEPENETDGEGNDEAGDNPPMNDESAEKPVDGTVQPDGKKRGRPAKKDVEQ